MQHGYDLAFRRQGSAGAGCAHPAGLSRSTYHAFGVRSTRVHPASSAPSLGKLAPQRLFQAIALIQQATTTQYLRLAKEQVRERDERLRAFDRTLTHELRNRLTAALGAGQRLQMPDQSSGERAQLTGVVVRNIDSMRIALDNLLELTRVNVDARHQRHVRLPRAAAEAARQLRDMARAQGVMMRIADDLPNVEVGAAAAELCLTNLLSNAIKYADAAEPVRWLEVSGCVRAGVDGGPREVVIEVRDNGVGVPEAQRAGLVARFFRRRSDRPIRRRDTPDVRARVLPLRRARGSAVCGSTQCAETR
jgi:signal transduction histidine kinase